MKKILVIEDDERFRIGLVMVLRRHGYEVLDAGHGAAGLALAFAARPDLVLSDINLPGQNGLDVLRELRGRTETAAVPVILMTGQSQQADARSSMSRGADDYLTKPFAMEAMLAAVAARLQRQEDVQRAATVRNPGHLSLAEQLGRDAGDKGLVDRMTARGFRNILQAVVLVFVFTLIQMFALHRVCNQGMTYAKSLEHQGLPNLNHLAELREQMVLFRLSSYELMFAREGQKPALASAAKSAQKQIKADLLEIKKLLQDPKGQELTGALETAFDALAQEFERMQGLEEKDFAGAMSVLDHDIPPKIQSVDEAADKLNNLGYQFSDAQANAAFESFGRIKNETFFYGGANIVLAMGLVIFVLLAATKTRSQLVKALEQLRAQAQELRLQTSALEAAANGIVITDRNGKILWVNQAFTQLTGYAAAEAVGQNPHLLNSGRHPQAFFEDMWATILAGRVWRGELINKHKDGNWYDEEMTITPVRGENGEIHHFIAIKHDISERKKIEQMLAEERDLLQVLMNNLPDHIYFKDLDSRFTRINLAQARHLGLAKPEDAVGKSDADFFPAADARQKLTEERCLMATGKPMLDLVEKSNTTKGTHWVASTKVPIYGVDGKIAGLVGISHDITKIKLTEDELRWKTAFLEAQVSSSIDGILVVDEQGVKILQNQRMTDLFKIPRDLAADRAAATQRQWIADMTVDPEQFLKKVHYLYSQPNETSRIEIELKDGTILDMYSSPVIDPGGKYYGRIWTFRDITERKRMEESVRQSEQCYRGLFENMNEGFAYCRMIYEAGQPNDFVYLAVNQTFSSLTGLTGVVGKKATEAIPGIRESDSDLLEIYGQVAATGKPERCERFVQALQMWFDLSVYSTEPGFFVVVFDVITERKRAEAELQESRRFLQSTLDALSSHIAILDEQGTIVKVNTAWNRFARENGFTGNAGGVGDNYLEICDSATGDSAEGSAAAASGIRAVMAGQNDVFHLEYPCHSPQGRRWFAVRATRFDVSGPVQVVVAHENITERKRAEEELRRKSAFLEAQVNSSIDGILVVDEQGRRVLQNQRITDIFAVPQSVVDDTNDVKFLNWVTQMTQKPEPFLDQVRYLHAHPDQVSQDEIELKNGTILDRYSAPMTGKDGQFYGRVWTFRDITKRKREELERQMMELQLRQSQKLESVGQLAAGIAHEINTPTQYVGDNTRFFKDSFTAVAKVLDSYEALLAATKAGTVTPELVARSEQILVASDLDYLRVQIPQALNETLEGVERVSKIVRAMKEFSHPGGREKNPADLNKAIESTVTVARNEWKYVADLKLELEPSLPFVPCFLGEFNQAVLNLIVNAAHAIGDVVKKNPGTKGLITVQTRRDGEYAEVRVADTGTGIPPAARLKIFAPFFTTKEVGKGTGQGLAMVYGSIVNRHGGTVTFETEVDRGTTFIMRLPVKPKTKAETTTPKRENGAA